jgi:hypothetical protein
MSTTVNVNGNLQIQDSTGRLRYQRSSSFQSTGDGDFVGPTPGTVTATTTGVAVSLSQLTNPGPCYMQNLSLDYRAVVGIMDTSSGTFLPLLEFLPGEGYPVRLARMIEDELSGGAGTGTGGSGGSLWVKGVGGTVRFLVEAFEG